MHKCVPKDSSCGSLLCLLDMLRCGCVCGGCVCMYMRVLDSGFECKCGLCMCVYMYTCMCVYSREVLSCVPCLFDFVDVSVAIATFTHNLCVFPPPTPPLYT